MSVVRLHFVVPLIAVYVCVRPLIGQALGASAGSSSEGEAPVIPIPTTTLSAHETLTHAMGGNGSGLISPHHDPLFGPHDPNRSYDANEKKYFQVGVVDFDRVKTPFIIGTWILAASLAKIGFHMFPKLSHMFPESCLLIVLGVLVGTILYFGGLGDVEAAHHLDPDIFFLFMLPPIILDAGYFMPNRLFFDNLGTILVFAVIGTIFNTFTIGAALYFVGLTGIYGVSLPILNTFVFASLISAVDPVAVLAVFEEIHVNEMLYIVVFGESLLNDAVTVVLYHMFEAYVEMGEGNITALDVAAGLLKFLLVAFGGVIVGVVWGFLTAFVTRFTSSVRVIEPLFVFVMAYLAYLNAEIFHMSGILSITFCGLTMKNYVISNVSAKSHTTIKYTMKMLSSSSETVIFMLLGVATVHNHHEWNTFFVFFTILFCSLFRSIGVLILAGIVNQFRMDKIATVDKFVMAYGGLRGAVAFALVLLIDPHHVPQQQMFLTTTIAVVYFTVFVQGISVGPLVEKLGVKKSNKRELTMNERIHERSLDHIMTGVEDIVGHPGRHYVRSTFKHFNHKYLRPLLTHEDTSRDPKIMETFSRLALKDAMKSAVDDVINGPTRTPRAAKLPANDSWADIRRDSINWQHAQVSNTLSGRPARDISEATIQHLLGNTLPNVRQRRWSYSRHAVRDEDMHTRPFQHQIPVFERQRVIDMHRKRKIRNQHVLEPRLVSESPSVHRVVFKTGESVDGRASVGADGGSAATVHGIEFVVGEDGRVSPSEEGTLHTTEVESVLPWKRNDESEVCHRPLKWHNTSAPAWIANEDYSRYKSPPVSLVAEDIPIDGSTSIPDSVSDPGRRRNSLATSFLEGLTSLRASFRRSQRKCSMPPRFDDSAPGGVDRKLTDPCCRMKPGLDVCADVEGGYVNFGVVSEDEANVQYRTRI